MVSIPSLVIVLISFFGGVFVVCLSKRRYCIIDAFVFVHSRNKYRT